MPSLTTIAGIRDDTAVEPRTRLAAAVKIVENAGAVVSKDDGAGDGVKITIHWPDRA